MRRRRVWLAFVFLALAPGGCGTRSIGRLTGNEGGTSGGAAGAAGGGVGGSGGTTGSAGTGGSAGSGDAAGSAGTIADGGVAGTDAAAGAGGAAPAGPFAGVLAGRVTMDGTPDGGTVIGAGVAGVTVTLDGPVARAALTDANGAYRFVGLPAGTYAVAVAKPGAVFAAPLAEAIAVAGEGPGVVRDFGCAAPCGDGPAIDSARELYIQDPSVLGGARADNMTDGPWSFRFLMEQIASNPPNVFAEEWLADLAATGRDITKLRNQWPTIAENGRQLPDLSRAPFQLLAIVNRIDAFETGNGELRFVYGLKVVNGAPELHGQALTLTVALHFRLPSTSALPDRAAWARKLHELGAVPFEGGAYAAKLQEVTDLVARAGVVGSVQDNPRGTTFAVLRTSDGFTSGPAGEGWQLREFRAEIDPVRARIALRPSPTHQTPDSALNGADGALPDFLNANAALIQAGAAPLPAGLLGMKSGLPTPAGRWTFPSVISEPLRHAFAGQTCVGCHGTETGASFHINPMSGQSPGNFSGLVVFQEIPRRVSFMQHLLTCQPPACAAGGEEMIKP